MDIFNKRKIKDFEITNQYLRDRCVELSNQLKAANLDLRFANGKIDIRDAQINRLMKMTDRETPTQNPFYSILDRAFKSAQREEDSKEATKQNLKAGELLLKNRNKAAYTVSLNKLKMA
jgi:hypothetical protein